MMVLKTNENKIQIYQITMHMCHLCYWVNFEFLLNE